MIASTDRVEKIRACVDEILLQMPDPHERRCAYLHLYGVAQACAMIAMKRNERVELAIAAGMMHDLASYSTSDSRDHGPRSAILARKILQSLACFEREEMECICSAISCHSEKEKIHDSLAEVLIDGDVWQHYLYHPGQHAYARENDRIARLKKEFGIFA